MFMFVFDYKSTISLPLDPEYRPIAKNFKMFETIVASSPNPVSVTIAIKRSERQIARITKQVFDDPSQQEENYLYIERYIKTLLWLKGGYHIYYHGPKDIGERLKKEYSKDGKRSFDVTFMEGIYQQRFQVDIVPIDQVPNQQETSIPMGRHLDGCRIGFDAGGSDRKVSAVIDGTSIYSEEVVWHPKTNSDPNYHYQGILDSMTKAASKLPRVDAIGVSSAGIFIDDEVAAASLFRQVPSERFDTEVRPIFKRIAKELGDVPIKVANDGDVTALAGAMSLDDTNILGIAMGTSQAAGYVDSDGCITGWLNELAFVPVDLNADSMIDEWSTDYGVGVTYFSQDAVIKLAAQGQLELDPSLSPAEKLKVVQEYHNNGNEVAEEIFRTIGIYLGYSIAYYSEFYDLKHVLILGRVTSGRGGETMLRYTKELLQEDYPNLAEVVDITLPDETSRRVGQSIAAASLPQI
jgi:predicted NBD/HSP70 family sugar kinase